MYSLFETIFGTLAVYAVRISFAALVALSLTNMILISRFGLKQLEIFGYLTNTGNVFHVITLLIMAVIIEKYGRIKAFEAVSIIGFCLVFYVAMSYAALAQPVVQGNEEIHAALQLINNINVRIIVASFITFFFINPLFILCYDYAHKHYNKVKSMLFACSISQAFDSLIFFSLAFGGILPINLLLEFIVVGFVFKMFFHIVTIPVFKRMVIDYNT